MDKLDLETNYKRLSIGQLNEAVHNLRDRIKVYETRIEVIQEIIRQRDQLLLDYDKETK